MVIFQSHMEMGLSGDLPSRVRSTNASRWPGPLEEVDGLERVEGTWFREYGYICIYVYIYIYVGSPPHCSAYPVALFSPHLALKVPAGHVNSMQTSDASVH